MAHPTFTNYLTRNVTILTVISIILATFGILTISKAQAQTPKEITNIELEIEGETLKASTDELIYNKSLILWDLTTNTQLKVCTTGKICEAEVAGSGQHETAYQAFLAEKKQDFKLGQQIMSSSVKVDKSKGRNLILNLNHKNNKLTAHVGESKIFEDNAIQIIDVERKK